VPHIALGGTRRGQGRSSLQSWQGSVTEK